LSFWIADNSLVPIAASQKCSSRSGLPHLRVKPARRELFGFANPLTAGQNTVLIEIIFKNEPKQEWFIFAIT